MRNFILVLVIVSTCLLIAVEATGQTVDFLLAKFAKQENVTVTNQFFEQLRQEGFLDEQVRMAEGTPVDSLRQQVWYWAAEWYYDQQQYKQAEQYALKSLPLYHPANDSKADCLNLLGLIYVRMGDIRQAANYARQCLDIDMKSGDDDRISSSMNTVAGIYMAGYQAKEAEQYILGALEHAQKADNPARKAVILGMASEIYHTLGDDQKALPYAEQAYAIDSLLGRQPQASIRLSQKGSALLGLHRYHEAEAIYRQITPTLKEVGDYHSYAIALNRLGMSLLCQERQQEAIPYYKEAATLFSKMGDLYNEIHAHRGLYESYWKLNPDSAKAELDYFDLLKDSLYSHATADALSRYNAEFGNDRLKQENAEVRSAHQRTIVIAVIVLLLVVAVAWWLVRRTRRQEKERIEALMQEIARLEAGDRRQESGDRSQEAGDRSQEAGDRSQEEITNEDRLFLMHAIETVNEGLADRQWSVEVIASRLNMSVQTFRRRLVNATGESPKAFISAIQMEKAGKLLTEQPELPIVDVAFRCGFDEASSFTHTFKRIYGVTPTQYREQQQ